MYDIIFIGEKTSEWDQLKSRFPTAKRASTFDDAVRKSFTKMFWVVPDDVIVSDDFDFSITVPEWDHEYTHVFKNGEFYDGIMLCSKHAKISKREFEYRFVTHKKEHAVIASTPKPYDIVFISYQEPNADENYQKLLSRFPRAKRVHGVKGIHQAHIEAAKQSSTDMFWVVDGDAVILDDFDFTIPQIAKYNTYEKAIVRVWRAMNPINGLVYGYGGVKLLPKALTLNVNVDSPDMTTSISASFKAVEDVSNITAFNTDPFNTWKSAFRECVKLSSKIIDRQKTAETDRRLRIWQSIGGDKPFGMYAINGAVEGYKYGSYSAGDPEKLAKINDFDWLKARFDAVCDTNEN